MQILLAALIIASASSPEEFLDELCANSTGLEGAVFWSESASENAQNNLTGIDTLQIILVDKIDLNVMPGTRTLFSGQDSLFIIEYGRSSWTWADPSGRTHKVDGLTALECRTGVYRWTRIPLLEHGSVSVGTTEKLVTGFVITLVVLLFAVILVAWAKRRYL